uniref:Reverse transcriptase domain-containing protein n=1 Tax=Photinus pyralis TaxID=7054 RepID=A0A1Y1K388_PHOPY
MRNFHLFSKKKNDDLPSQFNDPEIINNYFSDVITQNKILPDFELLNFYIANTKSPESEPFTFTLINEAEIAQILATITTRSVGADEISISMVAICLPFLLPYLLHVINCCLESSYFPNTWKRAHVLPLPKCTEFIGP